MKIQDKAEKVIMSQQKVVFLLGNPGMGKSAMAKTIADKNKLMFIDVRLSQIDSSEILGIPHRKKVGTGDTEVMDYAVPYWAWQANQQPSLIFFDELNRATLETRNAALQILLDRQIGHHFKFNDNVYMASAGNRSENCEVEEFDLALNDRLAILNFELTIEEWIENYADKNVNPNIVSFIRNNPKYFYLEDTKNKVIATPRSWTKLSNFALKEKCKSIRDLENLSLMFGDMYVGGAVARFVKYLQDISAININDILNSFDAFKEKIITLARDRQSELLKELEKINIDTMTKEKVKNMMKFLELIHEDERASYFNFVAINHTKWVDQNKTSASDNVKELVKKFQKDFEFIYNAKE